MLGELILPPSDIWSVWRLVLSQDTHFCLLIVYRHFFCTEGGAVAGVSRWVTLWTSSQFIAQKQLFALVLKKKKLLYKLTLMNTFAFLLQNTLPFSLEIKKNNEVLKDLVCCMHACVLLWMKSCLAVFSFVFSLCCRHQSQVLLHFPFTGENSSGRETNVLRSFNLGFIFMYIYVHVLHKDIYKHRVSLIFRHWFCLLLTASALSPLCPSCSCRSSMTGWGVTAGHVSRGAQDKLI